MSLLESIRKNPAVGVVCAVVLLALAAYIAFSQTSSSQRTGSGESYYYDLKSGKLFTARPRGISPVDSPDGGPGQGAIAHVFACGQCTQNNLTIVAIETISPEGMKVQKQLEADPKSVPPQTIATVMATANRLAEKPATPGGEPKWVVKSSPDGYAILAKAEKLCDGKPAKQCRP